MPSSLRTAEAGAVGAHHQFDCRDACPSRSSRAPSGEMDSDVTQRSQRRDADLRAAAPATRPADAVLDDAAQVRLAQLGRIETQHIRTVGRHGFVPDGHALVGRDARRIHALPRAQILQQRPVARRDRRHAQLDRPRPPAVAWQAPVRSTAMRAGGESRALRQQQRQRGTHHAAAHDGHLPRRSSRSLASEAGRAPVAACARRNPGSRGSARAWPAAAGRTASSPASRASATSGILLENVRTSVSVKPITPSRSALRRGREIRQHTRRCRGPAVDAASSSASSAASRSPRLKP